MIAPARVPALPSLQENVVSQTLQDQTYDQLGFQNKGQPAQDAIVSYPFVSNSDGGQQIPGLQGSMAPLDSNLFSYLAGNSSVPIRTTQEGCSDGRNASRDCNSNFPPLGAGVSDQGVRRQPMTPTTSPDVAGSMPPPGLVASDASQTPPSTAELNMLLKLIQTYLANGFPKLEIGELATRPARLVSWRQNIVTTLKPMGQLALDWWYWIVHQAEATHARFVKASLVERNSIVPEVPLPSRFSAVDAWLHPKLLDAIPGQTRSLVEGRARIGVIDQSHLVMFWVFKQFVPGGIDEQLAVMQSVRGPKQCASAKAAQVELLRWMENVRRMAALQLPPLPLFESYMAMESIFAQVFEKADQQLNLRWVSLKNELGLPHRIELDTLTKVYAFAEQELGALVLLPNANQNSGLPLTNGPKAQNA